MCEQCSAATVNYGEVVPDWHLVRATKDGNFMKKDDWGLVLIDDPSFWWSETPIKDVSFGMTGAQLDDLNEEEDKLFNDFWNIEEKIAKKLVGDIMSGHCLVQSCYEAGYQRKEGFIIGWLIHKMALLIEANPNGLLDKNSVVDGEIKLITPE